MEVFVTVIGVVGGLIGIICGLLQIREHFQKNPIHVPQTFWPRLRLGLLVFGTLSFMMAMPFMIRAVAALPLTPESVVPWELIGRVGFVGFALLMVLGFGRATLDKQVKHERPIMCLATLSALLVLLDPAIRVFSDPAAWCTVAVAVLAIPVIAGIYAGFFEPAERLQKVA